MPVGHRAWTEAGRTYLATLGQAAQTRDVATLWGDELALGFQALEQVVVLIRQVDQTLDTLAATDPRM